MTNFSINNSTVAGFGGTQQAMTTTYKTITLLGVGNTTVTSGAPSGGAPSPYNPRRGKVYDLLVGTNGTPADNFCTWDLSRASALGSTTTSGFAGALSSVSSNYSLDPADGLIQAYSVVNSSVETNLVYTNSVWSVGVNQRASYRWVAAPGSEFVYPATSSAGFGCRMLSGGYTGTATVTVLFQEQ